MSEEDWDMLFDLILKALRQTGLGGTDVGSEICKQAEIRGAMADLEDFCYEVEKQ